MGKNDIAETIQEHGQGPIDAALCAPVAERTQTPSPTLQTSSPKGQRINMADVKPKPIIWLWEHRVAAGKFTILDGDPDKGKSLITLDLAARVSAGRPMPLETTATREPCNVLLMACEDDKEDTLSPRLTAAGADMGRITLIPDLLAINENLADIEAHIAATDAKLLIIDPLTAYLSGRINTNSDHEVRTALMPLAQMAARLGVAIIGVRHFNKQQGLKAMHRGGGSVAFVGVARTAFAVGIDPENDDARILAPIKGNVVAKGNCPALRYRVVSTEDKQPRIEWLGPCDISADDICREPDPDASPSALADAREFLREFLSAGEKAPKDVYEVGRTQKLSERTLRRAARALGIPRGNSWMLPAAQMKTAADVGASP